MDQSNGLNLGALVNQWRATVSRSPLKQNLAGMHIFPNFFREMNPVMLDIEL